MGKTCEGGRDLDGIEPVEYCDSRFLEACDIGRGSVLRREGFDVISGGKAGWFGFVEEGSVGGDVAGDEVIDITAGHASRVDAGQDSCDGRRRRRSR